MTPDTKVLGLRKLGVRPFDKHYFDKIELLLDNLLKQPVSELRGVQADLGIERVKAEAKSSYGGAYDGFTRRGEHRLRLVLDREVEDLNRRNPRGPLVHARIQATRRGGPPVSHSHGAEHNSILYARAIDALLTVSTPLGVRELEIPAVGSSCSALLNEFGVPVLANPAFANATARIVLGDDDQLRAAFRLVVAMYEYSASRRATTCELFPWTIR